MEVVQSNKKEIAKEVKKPIEAIQCTNNFSLLQRKMYNVLLANAAGNLRPDVTHKISIGNLCKLMGYRSNDYKTIRDYFRALMQIKIEWDIINEKGNKVWTISNPLSLARVTEGEGVCEYEFANGILPFLDRPAQYAKFSLTVQSKFKSNYGLALYENCERYRNLGQTRAFDIETFRKLMGLKEGEYHEFFAMKRRVIGQAVKEVNKIADFDVRPDYEKVGRQVTKVKFFILSKKLSIKMKDNVANGNELEKILIEIFGLSEIDVKKICDKYEKEYINEKVDYILNSNSFKTGGINNMAGYLKTALDSDYKMQKSSKTIIKENQEKELEKQRFIEKQEKTLSDARLAYVDYYLSVLEKTIEALDENEKNIFLEQYEQFIRNTEPWIYSSFKKYGYKSRTTSLKLKMFVEENFSHKFPKILTQDEYFKESYPHIYEYSRKVNEC